MDFLFKIHAQGFKLRGKVVLFVSLEHLLHFWAIWINFGWFFGQNWPNLTSYRPVFGLFMQNSNSRLKTVWKSGLVWLSRPLDTVLAIWSNIWPILVQKWPNLTFYGQNVDILCKIHTQGLKLYGKMALFDPLGLLIRFWPFGPILDLLGPIYPKEPGKPQLFSSLPDFTYL